MRPAPSREEGHRTKDSTARSREGSVVLIGRAAQGENNPWRIAVQLCSRLSMAARVESAGQQMEGAMSLKTQRAEFERHVWDHAADAFQMQFDERRALTSEEHAFLTRVLKAIAIAEDELALRKLRLELAKDTASIGLVLQLCGLTRNKILMDLRASRQVKGAGIKIPSSFKGLAAPQVWPASGPYLLSRLRTVFGVLDPGATASEKAFEAINQATWPGYIRQERAKRSGHEAEYRLATLLATLKIPFEPFEKSDNPLCRDAQIGGISFDIVIPDVKNPLILIKSTVHTANIGQYGESKDNLEITEAKAWIDGENWAANSIPTLVAFIDGVGFRSNSAGLNGVLERSDEFCQFKTLWKAALMAAVRLDLKIQVALPQETIDEFEDFIQKWNASSMVVAIESLKSIAGWVEAGDAFIRRRDF